MRIPVPERFQYPGQLPARLAGKDPRALSSFDEPTVEIDMRACSFIRPAAVLWCLTYPLLARLGPSNCRLLVPENLGVCVYLKSLGLFELLQRQGVEVDDRGVPDRPDPQLVLPLTGFESEFRVEELANGALDQLSAAGLGARNLHPLVSEVFAELALNAVQHSFSPIGAYGFIQFYEFAEAQRFICVVADGGIGIRRSLEQNPDVRDRVSYDWDAIELAVRERVSGTGDKTRGIGLYGVAEDMRNPGRSLIIHSGIGSLQITERVETSARRTTLFPGTLASASIPT